MGNTFSERMGINKPRTVIQSDSIDTNLQTSLWNCIYSIFISDLKGAGYNYPNIEFGKTFTQIWLSFFNKRIDEIPNQGFHCADFLKVEFFKLPWFEIYDLIEFIIANHSDSSETEFFIELINHALEKELSGYRIIANKVAPIISKQEVETIESALEINETVSFHINESLKLLSDKENPDYRNSIKESISSVEAIARLITGNNKATLGNALNEIESAGDIEIHGALKSGFSSIYGWTSSDQGIRHSLLEAPSVDQEDAIYMLVSCSAFVNYLYSKSLKIGLDLSKSNQQNQE